MSALSGISPYNASGYDYSGSTSTGPASATNTSLNNALPAQDSVDLQSDASLIDSMFPQSTLSAPAPVGYPTNIEQAAQNQAILANNPNLAQMISQESSSPVMEPLMADLQVLQTTESASQISTSQTAAGQYASSSLSPAISGMEALQDVAAANAFTSNPSMAQSLLQSYDPGLILPQVGSLIDTTV